MFDDYSGADHKNVLTSNESSKDYGDFFEDEPSVKRTDNKADDTKKIEEKTTLTITALKMMTMNSDIQMKMIIKKM